MMSNPIIRDALYVSSWGKARLKGIIATLTDIIDTITAGADEKKIQCEMCRKVVDWAKKEKQALQDILAQADADYQRKSIEDLKRQVY